MSRYPTPFTVTLGGTPLSCIQDPGAATDETAGYNGTFAPQDATRTFVKRDVPIYLNRFSRGMGFVERRDEEDDGGYAWAEDMMMWGGFAIPSGRRQNVGGSYGVTNAGVVIDSAVFNGHLYALCVGKVGVRWPNADPTQAPVVDPPLNTFGDATASYHTGYIPQAMAVFSDASGNPALCVSAFNSGTSATRIYQNVGGVWTNPGGILGYRASKMAVCWWEGRDGAGAERLHILADARTQLRHCIQGNDPTAGASYVTPITVGNAAYDITQLVATPGHLFAVKRNGIHDFNELRSWNLTPYWEESSVGASSNVARVYDEHIFAARGFSLDRYDLRQDGTPQRLPGECAPMAFMQDGTPIVGYPTASTTHDGWLLLAIYNPYNRTTYVVRGKDRRHLNVDVPNPMVWHGAEQVIKTDDVLIAHMRVTPNAASTFGQQSAYLWMFGAAGYSGISTPDLYYAPVPSVSGSLSARASGGSFSYNPTGYVFHAAHEWGDRAADKGVHRIDVSGKELSATSTIEIRSRTESASPATIADTTTYTSQGTATSNTTTLRTQLQGHAISLLSILTTPSPYTAPPILHEISPRARVARETFDTRTLFVVLERDYELVEGQMDPRSPDETFAAIRTAQDNASVQAFRDEKARLYSVYVEQGVRYGRNQLEDGEWRTTARIELTLIEQVA